MIMYFISFNFISFQKTLKPPREIKKDTPFYKSQNPKGRLICKLFTSTLYAKQQKVGMGKRPHELLINLYTKFCENAQL